LDLSFARRGDRTVLDRRRFRWPFVLTRTFALDSCPRHMLTVIVQTSSGALHGEDRLSQWFEVGENAAAHITTQGASAVHRASGGLESRDSGRLSVAQGGFLEYLPEPRILFPGARSNRRSKSNARREGRRSSATPSRSMTLVAAAAASGDFALRRSCDAAATLSLSIEWISTLSSLEKVQPSAPSLPGLDGVASLLPAEAGIGVRLAGRELRNVRAGIATIWFGVRSALYGAPPDSRRKGDDPASILDGAPNDLHRS
jgi:urease accessory protein